MDIAVTICTRQRPRMLERCLISVVNQSIPDGVRLSVVVVENNHTASCREIVEAVATSSRQIDIRYSLETRIGIPIARNHAVELALAGSPAWICFVDDDEIVVDGWVCAYVDGIRTFEADVFAGPVEQCTVDGQNHWLIKKRKSYASGTPRSTAYTSNNWTNASVFRNNGRGLRFNEAWRLTGGSDSELYKRAIEQGVLVRWVDEALVRETLKSERLTWAWNLERERRNSANNMTLLLEEPVTGIGCIRLIRRCFVKLAAALTQLPLSALVCLIAPNAGRRMAYGSMANLWWLSGLVGACIGYRPTPYQSIVGE